MGALVRDHEEIEYTGSTISDMLRHIAITEKYMGGFAEWASLQGWVFSYKGDCWHNGTLKPTTTTELINNYIETLKNK